MCPTSMYLSTICLLPASSGETEDTVELSHTWTEPHLPTFMRVSIPLFLHHSFKVELENLVQNCDPLFHFYFTVCCQQVTTFVLHLELKSKTPDFVVLKGGKETHFRRIGTPLKILLFIVCW